MTDDPSTGAAKDSFTLVDLAEAQEMIEECSTDGGQIMPGALAASIAVVIAERRESLRLFDAHIEAVKKWTTNLAGYLPFMDDGKVTPQDFIVAASAAQQWTGNLMARAAQLEAEVAMMTTPSQAAIEVGAYMLAKSAATWFGDRLPETFDLTMSKTILEPAYYAVLEAALAARADGEKG